MNKKHAPTVYRVYDYISAFCKGKANAVPAIDLADAVGLMIYECDDTRKRALRKIVNIIRRDTTFDNMIASGNQGYWWASKEEARKANARLFSQAFDLLKTAYAQEKKIAADGQFLMQLTPHTRQAVHSLCEVSELKQRLKERGGR